MKRVISVLLSISMITGLFCTPVFGVQADLYDDSGGYVDFDSSEDIAGDGYEHETLIKDIDGPEDKTDDNKFSVDDSADSIADANDYSYKDEIGNNESLANDLTDTTIDLDDQEIVNIPEDELGEGYVTCPHGKVRGESCVFCGELAHSYKNIPLVGYEQEFFDQVNPDEDEGWSLFTIRLVCQHGTADGVYCDQCGRIVDVDDSELPRCTILDSCIHGHVTGEKCLECQMLKEEQGDYELTEGEEWDDPLIYATEPMQYIGDISYIFNQHRYCIWCDDGKRIGVSRVFGDAWNVQCHKDSNGKYHWDYIAYVEATGTCRSHSTTVVYQCGARANYSQNHSHACTYGETMDEHSTVITQPTCLREGRRQIYYTRTCENCGGSSSATGNRTETIPTLHHIVVDYEYADSNTHLVSCSGNGTSAHSMTENHDFQKSNEDYKCTGCDAVKTTVHIDAYSESGMLLKSDLVTDTVEVGHNGPDMVSIQDYWEQIQKVVSESVGLNPLPEQTDSVVVQAGGIRLECVCKEIDSIEVRDYTDTYYFKSNFEDKGTILVTYKDGTSVEVPLTKDKVISGFETDTVGEKSLTVRYGGMTTSYSIQVIYRPAMIKVNVSDGYAQSKPGKIVITGDGDYVTFPDGTTKPCDEVRDYLFTENGTFPFTVTGMDKGTNTDIVIMDRVDNEAPILTAIVENGKITIKCYDDKSGLHTVTYFESTDTTAAPQQFVGEENQKTIEASIDGVAYGIYRIVATDYAGNSRNFDIAINVDKQVDNSPFSMYVPSSVSFYVDKEGAVSYSFESTNIYNGSDTKSICIKAINVIPLGDWQIVDYNTDFSQYEKDSPYVAMSINGCPVNSNGIVKINAEDWVVAADGTLSLNMDIKVPKQTETRYLPDVLKINFVGDWYSEDDIIGEKHLITIMPPDKAALSPNVTAIYTNNFGKITYLPRIIDVEDSYIFVKWVNAETSEEVRVGQVLTEDITVKAEVKQEYIDFVITPANRSKIGYKGIANEELVIPATFTDVDGTKYRVTAIAYMSGATGWRGAFEDCKNLKSVVLPDTLTSIGSNAFWDCTGLKSITIPSSVNDIGSGAFYQSGLQSVVLPNGLKSIATNTFANCGSLESVKIPQSVTRIETAAFYGTKLTTIDIPNSVTQIDCNAFRYCKSLKSFIFPQGITCITNGTLAECSALTSVFIPDGVKSIECDAFTQCPALRNLVVPDSVTSIQDGAFRDSNIHVEYHGPATGAPWGAKSVN